MRVVLDANIFLSALFSPNGICAEILRKFAMDDAFTLVMSKSIYSELRSCLLRPKILRATKRSSTELLEWLESISAMAIYVDDLEKAKGICRDPKDEIYLSAALVSNSVFLVTGDNDLLVLQSISRTLIVGPKQFMEILDRI